MGLFDDITSTLGSAFSDVFGGASGSQGGSYLGGLDTGTSPFPVSSFPTVPEYSNPYPMGQPTASMMPMIAGAARWALQFPNLWQALQRIRANYRVAISVDKLWGMVKSMGPNVIVGLIGAAALQELFVYHSTHKRRRMNVANTKALRRSVRRLKGFDRLSHKVSSQLSRVGGTRRRSASRRCGTCRKSPCAC
jgi:hypothetical protein